MNSGNVTKMPTGSASSKVSQLLTFKIGQEEYGIDILSVVEIRGWEEPTPIPSSAIYVKGVINMRGIIVPIIDLRQRFGMQVTNHGPTTVIIVLQLQTPEGKRINGIVVDAVSDVHHVNEKKINETPNVGNIGGKEFISGLVNLGSSTKEKMVIVLDVVQIVKLNESALTQEAVVAAEEKIPAGSENE